MGCLRGVLVIAFSGLVFTESPVDNICEHLDELVGALLPQYPTNSRESPDSHEDPSPTCCGCISDLRSRFIEHRCTSNISERLFAVECTCSSDDPDCDGVPDLPEPFTTNIVADIGCGLIFSVVAAFTAAAGVGGGGIYVPIMMTALSFPANVATATAQFLIFGSSMGGFFLNVRARHPSVDRPLIDPYMLLFFAPAMMAGAQGGVILNQILPDVAIRGSFLVMTILSLWSSAGVARKRLIADRKAARKCRVPSARAPPLVEASQACLAGISGCLIPPDLETIRPPQSVANDAEGSFGWAHGRVVLSAGARPHRPPRGDLPPMPAYEMGMPGGCDPPRDEPSQPHDMAVAVQVPCSRRIAPPRRAPITEQRLQSHAYSQWRPTPLPYGDANGGSPSPGGVEHGQQEGPSPDPDGTSSDASGEGLLNALDLRPDDNTWADAPQVVPQTLPPLYGLVGTSGLVRVPAPAPAAPPIGPFGDEPPPVAAVPAPSSLLPAALCHRARTPPHGASGAASVADAVAHQRPHCTGSSVAASTDRGASGADDGARSGVASQCPHHRSPLSAPTPGAGAADAAARTASHQTLPVVPTTRCASSSRGAAIDPPRCARGEQRSSAPSHACNADASTPAGTLTNCVCGACSGPDAVTPSGPGVEGEWTDARVSCAADGDDRDPDADAPCDCEECMAPQCEECGEMCEECGVVHACAEHDGDVEEHDHDPHTEVIGCGVVFCSGPNFLSELDNAQHRLLCRLRHRDAKLPFRELSLLFALWLVTTTILMFRGGAKADPGTGMEPCGPLYWGLWVVAVAILVLFSGGAAFGAVRWRRVRDKVGYDHPDGSLLFSPVRAVWMGCFTLCGGVVAGIVGSGGGTILGPMLLTLGVQPSVAAATNGTLVLVTSASAALAFLAAGSVPPLYAGYLGLCCFFGAIFGKFWLDRFAKRYHLTSLFIVILAVNLAFSLVMLLAQTAVLYTREGVGSTMLRSICPQGDLCTVGVCPYFPPPIKDVPAIPPFAAP